MQQGIESVTARVRVRVRVRTQVAAAANTQLTWRASCARQARLSNACCCILPFVTDSFSKFLKRCGTVVERALTEQATFDILKDYSKGATSERTHGSDQLHKLLRFYDPTWCGDRAITDVHWSPHYPELLLVAYSASGRGQNLESALLGAPAAGDAHPDGLVLVWSLALPSRPEFILYSQSPILTARFHEFDAHLVVGGSYSGQVVTWDLRATSLPVQQTPVSDAAHTRPIFGMAMEGTGAAHALVTASTDGRVAWWNPRQLLQPNEVLQLALAQSDNDASGGGLSVSCIACVPGETVQLLVGMDSGRILAVAVHTHSAGVQREFHGHFGMVTALDTNPSKAKALQELVLSSSMDWTTRLWSLRQSDKPLVTFSHDSYDYVCDVRWSPVHPALFATANVAGDLTLWNVTASLDTPVTPPCKVSGNALTKLAWSREGCRLAAGDVTGAVHVYAIAEDMALPRHDEEHRLERLLHELTS
ncbi:WD40-repeat-containing domain protein [Tribonema minus]|uniref:WD40-repeat-containing domain protein n=1 Tax=Tribonema minus TaxID=303371 RepID=A0A836C896_9STRA|nr:WD40-repeat-containing domain protein [Tribonema minus]